MDAGDDANIYGDSDKHTSTHEHARANEYRGGLSMKLLIAFAILAATLTACTTEKTIVQQIVVTPTPGQQQLVPPAQLPPTEPPAPPPTATPEPPPPPTLPPPPPAPVQPIAPLPVAPQQPAEDPRANCHPSYPTLCLPGSPDLDCGDVSARRFPVTGSDPHGFDNDGDGIGCESS